MNKYLKKIVFSTLIGLLCAGLVGTGVDLPTSAASSGVTNSVSPIDLGRASNFVILASTNVSAFGDNKIIGDVGVDENALMYGITKDNISGVPQAMNETAKDGQRDLSKAYDSVLKLRPTGYTTGNLDRQTFTPGYYDASGATGITGITTLDADGKDDAVFIFKVTGEFKMTSGSKLVLAGGAKAGNVFWLVSDKVTIEKDSTFFGSILSIGDVKVDNNSVIEGRLLSLTGKVEISNSSIAVPSVDISKIPLPTSAAGDLRVVTRVYNDQGGTLSSNDVKIIVKNFTTNETYVPMVGGDQNRSDYHLAVGKYWLEAPAIKNYKITLLGDVTKEGLLTLLNGDDKTITVSVEENKVAIQNEIKQPAQKSGLSIDASVQPTMSSKPCDVTYMFKVYNSDKVGYRDVTIKDSVCKSVTYKAGDLNKNKILDKGETWVYVGKAKLSKSTTNHVVVKAMTNSGSVTTSKDVLFTLK